MKHLVQEAARAPLRELFKRSAARSDARGGPARRRRAGGGPGSGRAVAVGDAPDQARGFQAREQTGAAERHRRGYPVPRGVELKARRLSAADAEDDEGEEDDEW